MSALSRALSDLGPLLQVQESLVTQPAGTKEVQLCAANALRWGLLIAPAFANNTILAISTVPGNVSLGAGIIVQCTTVGGSVLSLQSHFNTRQHGTLPQKTWYGGIASAGVVGFSFAWTVIEIILLPVD